MIIRTVTETVSVIFNEHNMLRVGNKMYIFFVLYYILIWTDVVFYNRYSIIKSQRSLHIVELRLQSLSTFDKNRFDVTFIQKFYFYYFVKILCFMMLRYILWWWFCLEISWKQRMLAETWRWLLFFGQVIQKLRYKNKG